MRASRVAVTAVVVAAMTALSALPAAAEQVPSSPTPTASADTDTAVTTGGIDYSGNPDSESRLVAAEERRIATVRAVAKAAEWSGGSQRSSYRLETGSTYTLVLVARKAPYTVTDLERLAPRTFARQPDGAYLLSENILVGEGASLSLNAPDGLDLRLASSRSSFVSIVTIGGSLSITGTSDAPATITSWDNTEGKADRDTTDGRAYLRVIGGRAEFTHAAFSDLGFWSGTTGGVSLTGTDALDIGAAPAPANEDDGEAAGETIFGKKLLSAESDGAAITIEDQLSSFGYVSALISDSTFTGNAFGLFVSSAEGVVIRDVVVSDSLVDGIIMHRFVTNSEISRTTTKNNAVDGITLSRGTSGVVVSRATSTGNGANGITVNGRPLAEGPSATGIAIDSFGNNQVSNSTFDKNARYGVEVIGGTGVIVESNELTENSSGVVVTKNAQNVVIKNNLIVGSAKQAIALRDAGTDAAVTGNTIDGGDIGIYVRNSGGVFERNIVENVDNHGIALIGETGTSRVKNNTASGSGPSAIDVSRTENTIVGANNVEDWRSTKPLDVILRGIFQPLTIMWLLLGLLLLVTALTSIGRKNTGFRHPYAHLAPLSSYTEGVVDRESVRTARQPGATS